MIEEAELSDGHVTDHLKHSKESRFESLAASAASTAISSNLGCRSNLKDAAFWHEKETAFDTSPDKVRNKLEHLTFLQDASIKFQKESK